MTIRGRYGYVTTTKEWYYYKPFKIKKRTCFWYKSYLVTRKKFTIRWQDVIKYLLFGDDLDIIVHNKRKGE